MRHPLLVALALVTIAPGAMAQVAEMVFESRAPSIVVVRGGGDRQGSGVVVAPHLIATNCHVIQGGAPITVRQGLISHAARRTWQESERDICLLDAPTLEAPPTPIGSASTLRVGAQVFALGAPAGLELSLSAGIVSQLRGDDGASLVQTTAPISRGSSGGGLFDAEARLVGITTMYVREGQNLNFAVPAEWLTESIAALSAWRPCRAAPNEECLLSAAATIGRANSAARAIVGALIEVAAARSRAGDSGVAARLRNDARDAALRITEDRIRAGTLADVALAARQADHREEAGRLLREALTSAPRPRWEDADDLGWVADASLIQWIASTHLAIGNVSDALSIARGHLRNEPQIEVLSAISRTQLREGNRAGATDTRMEALAAARQNTITRSRVRGLTAVAVLQAEAGDGQAAAQTFGEARNVATRMGARGLGDLFDLLKRQAASGHASGALATARQLQPARLRSMALTYTAMGQTVAGDSQGMGRTLVEALRVARTDEPDSRGLALSMIALAYARADRTVEAHTIKREIRDTATRIEVLCAIAEGSGGSRDWREAERAISEGFDLARSLRNEDMRDEALRSLARAQAILAKDQAQANDIDAALATANEITDRERRGEALTAVAEAQMRSGDFAGHLLTRRRMVHEIARSGQTLRLLTQAQAQAGDLWEALATLEEIDGAAEQVRALGNIASLLVAQRSN